MSKHTKGEWKAAGRVIFANVNGSQFPIVIVQQLPCIGGDNDLAAERGCEQEHANVKLVAQAPAMYEALKALEQAASDALIAAEPFARHNRDLPRILRQEITRTRALLRAIEGE